MKLRSALPESADARHPSELPGLVKAAAAVSVHEVRAKVLTAGMDSSALAAQVLMTAIEGRVLSSASAEILHAIPVGGILLFSHNLGIGADAARALVDDCVKAVLGAEVLLKEPNDAAVVPSVRVKPFIAVDHEGGYVHRFGDDLTRLPSAAEFGALYSVKGADAMSAIIRKTARDSGKELASFGISLNLAPVVETAALGDALYQDERSYSDDPEITSEAAAAFARGMADAGIGCVVKHFPGSSSADPHNGPVSVNGDSDGLDALLAPFRNFLKRIKPVAVMVSHAVVEAVDTLPASLSRTIVSELLKDDLAFSGIAIADDFRMKAITELDITPARAVVKALSAGIDMVIVWPEDLTAVHGAIIDAVEEGSLPLERLREAAARIVKGKLMLGMDGER